MLSCLAFCFSLLSSHALCNQIPQLSESHTERERQRKDQRSRGKILAVIEPVQDGENDKWIYVRPFFFLYNILQHTVEPCSPYNHLSLLRSPVALYITLFYLHCIFLLLCQQATSSITEMVHTPCLAYTHTFIQSHVITQCSRILY